MITAAECKDYVRIKLLNLRNLHTFIISERFTHLFNCISDKDRSRLVAVIKTLDMIEITKLVRELEPIDLELLSVKDLRRMAQNLGVRNYNTITKDSLIESIKRYEKSRISRLTIENGKVHSDVKNPEEAIPRS